MPEGCSAGTTCDARGKVASRYAPARCSPVLEGRQTMQSVPISESPAALDAHLDRLEKRLGEIETRYAAWNRKLAQMSKDLVETGMDFWEALTAVHEIHVQSIKDGDCPVDFDALNEVLDELCAIYLDADPDQRGAIRGLLEHRQSVLKYLHGYMGRTARLLESSGDEKWLRLGLAAASIADQRVDWRDLMIRLGGLYLTAREVGISRPGLQFSAVAKISNTVGRYGGGSTSDLLRNFRKSAYLRSIMKPKP